MNYTMLVEDRKSKDKGIIYMFTNLKNGKSYIGQVVCAYYRSRMHRHIKADRYQTIFTRAMHKYGKEAFSLRILEEGIPRCKLDEMEMYWIAELKTRAPNGYNMTDGGGGYAGGIQSQETRDKIRNSLLGKKHTDERRRNLSIAHTGLKMSEESKMKVSDAFSKSVRCVETGEIFKSRTAAAKWVAGVGSGILRAIQTGVVYKGYHWEDNHQNITI